MLTGKNSATEPIMTTMYSDSLQACKSYDINIRDLWSPLPGISLSSPMTPPGHSPQRVQRVSSQFICIYVASFAGTQINKPQKICCSLCLSYSNSSNTHHIPSVCN